MICSRCGEVNPAEIHTCTPKDPLLESLRVPDKDVKGELVKMVMDSYARGVVDALTECAMLVEKMGAEGYGTLFIAAAIREGISSKQKA